LTVGLFNSGKIGGRRILSRKSPSWRICRKRNSKENAKISQVFTIPAQVMCGKGKRVKNKRRSRLRYNNSKIKT